MVKKGNTIVSKLVKKTNHNTRIEEIKKKIPNQDKYIITNDFTKFSGTIFDGSLKQAKLATKDDFDDFIAKIYFDYTLKNINAPQIKENI